MNQAHLVIFFFCAWMSGLLFLHSFFPRLSFEKIELIASLVDIRKAPQGSQFEFEVVTPGRIYFLQAPTEKEMNTWMSTLKPHMKGGSGQVEASGSSSAGGSDSSALRERDEKIEQLEQKLKLLQGEGGETDEQKLRLDLHAAKEEVEKLQSSLEEKTKQCGELEKKAQAKDDELQALQIKLKKAEEGYNEELTELKKEYFRACAIGIVQQRKITKDLPPVAELYKSCLDDNTEWKDFVPWIKTTLPKK